LKLTVLPLLVARDEEESAARMRPRTADPRRAIQNGVLHMKLKLIGALFLALAATLSAREAKPFEVFYRATVSESLCLLLPGHPMKFAVAPSSQPKDRLEISCNQNGRGDAPEVELKFWLDEDVPSNHYRNFRWGHDVAAKDSPMLGQFSNDPALCQKVKTLIEEVAEGAPKHATLHLMNAKLTAECLPDARWGMSLELHLVLNQP
jgi:hypothetical protein